VDRSALRDESRGEATVATPTPSRDRGADQTTPYVEDVTGGEPTIAPPDEPTPREPHPETHPKMSLEEAKKNLEDAESADAGEDV
jgi:hypothetical protein